MRFIKLLCLAKPRLSQQDLTGMIRTASTTIFHSGGQILDIDSYGDRPLGYWCKAQGERYNQVQWLLCCSCPTLDWICRQLTSSVVSRPPCGPSSFHPIHSVRSRLYNTLRHSWAKIDAFCASSSRSSTMRVHGSCPKTAPPYER